VTTWYAREAGRTLRSGSPRALALARTIRALADATDLPGVANFEASIRPVGRAWVRRVADRNLWVWYRLGEAELILVTVTTDPPVPIGE
jgi:hypothetical protein